MNKKKLTAGLKGKDPIITVLPTLLYSSDDRATYSKKSKSMKALGL